MANPEHVAILKQGVEAWNEWRSADDDETIPDLHSAGLSGADLSGIDLSGSLLFYTDLSTANLFRANLSNATLTGANLSGTNLKDASLSDANLARSNLSDANLISAVLFRSILSSAILSGVILNGANLLRTVFTDTDLSRTTGLETVRHHGPCSIGLDTIYKSGGNIPEVFLRGCGVPENFIEYMRSLAGSPIDYYSCFISYSHADKPFARRRHDALQGQGIRCWLDEHQLLPGDDIYDQVDQGLRLWDKVLLCCSQDSLQSWWVDNEISGAFAKEQQLMQQRGRKVCSLIPLNLDGYLLSGEWQNGKAQQVKTRLAADFTGWEHDNSKFEMAFERLVKALRADAGAREVPPVPKL